MSALHDQLDELLIEYLATLNLYQAAQAKVAAEAKNGYFALAQAKLALGPARIGQSGWDLSETVARHKVFASLLFTHATVAHLYDDSSIHATTSQSQNSKDSTTISLSLEPTLIPIPDDDAITPTTTPNEIRKRRPAIPPAVDPVVDLVNSIAASTISPKSKKDDDEKPKMVMPRDPIHQFAAFPPVSLKTAQNSFRKAVDGVLSVVEVICKLVDLEHRVIEVRSRIVESEKE